MKLSKLNIQLNQTEDISCVDLDKLAVTCCNNDARDYFNKEQYGFDKNIENTDNITLKGTLVARDGYLDCKEDLERDYFPDLKIEINTAYERIKDPEVFRILSNKAGTNRNGLTALELSAISDIATLFRDNTKLKYFNELNKTSVKTLLRDAFNGCTSLKEVNLDKITTLGGDTFRGSSLEEVYAPVATSTYVSDFANCSNLKKAILPELSSTGYMLFNACPKLEFVYAPKWKGDGGASNSFAGCTSLKVFITSSVEHWVKNVSFGNLNGNPITVAKTLYQGTLENYSEVTEIDLPDSTAVTKVNRYAFYNMSKLDKLNLPYVLDIDLYAFYNCNLSNINLPKVESVHDYAFNCTINDDIVVLPKLNSISLRGLSRIKFTSPITSLILPKVTSPGTMMEGSGNLRLILPSVITAYNHQAYQSAVNIKMIDNGYNCEKFPYGGNDVNANIIFRSSNTEMIGTNMTVNTTNLNNFSESTNYFVPTEAVFDYKNRQGFNKYFYKVYSIGGDKWKELFGSRNKYANLTDIERLWYTTIWDTDWSETPTRISIVAEEWGKLDNDENTKTIYNYQDKILLYAETNSNNIDAVFTVSGLYCNILTINGDYFLIINENAYNTPITITCTSVEDPSISTSVPVKISAYKRVKCTFKDEAVGKALEETYGTLTPKKLAQIVSVKKVFDNSSDILTLEDLNAMTSFTTSDYTLGANCCSKIKRLELKTLMSTTSNAALIPKNCPLLKVLYFPQLKTPYDYYFISTGATYSLLFSYYPKITSSTFRPWGSNTAHNTLIDWGKETTSIVELACYEGSLDTVVLRATLVPTCTTETYTNNTKGVRSWIAKAVFVDPELYRTNAYNIDKWHWFLDYGIMYPIGGDKWQLEMKRIATTYAKNVIDITDEELENLDYSNIYIDYLFGGITEHPDGYILYDKNLVNILKKSSCSDTGSRDLLLYDTTIIPNDFLDILGTDGIYLPDEVPELNRFDINLFKNRLLTVSSERVKGLYLLHPLWSLAFYTIEGSDIVEI